MRITLALALLVASTGCADGYIPKTPGRIAFARNELYKDGHSYRPGLFGGNLDEAVAGDARAEAEMSTYTTQESVSSGFFLAALGLLGGFAYAASHQPATKNEAPLGLALGAVGADLFALGFSSAASRHLHNAVNMYNDDAAAAATASSPHSSFPPSVFPMSPPIPPETPPSEAPIAP